MNELAAAGTPNVDGEGHSPDCDLSALSTDETARSLNMDATPLQQPQTDSQQDALDGNRDDSRSEQSEHPTTVPSAWQGWAELENDPVGCPKGFAIPSLTLGFRPSSARSWLSGAYKEFKSAKLFHWTRYLTHLRMKHLKIGTCRLANDQTASQPMV